MDARMPSDPAPFDATLFEMVRGLLPVDRLYAHLEELDRQFLELADSTPATPGLQQQAHTIVSQAGMFGLIRMSECARELENACRQGADRAAALTRFGEAMDDVRLYALPAVEQLSGAAKSTG